MRFESILKLPALFAYAFLISCEFPDPNNLPIINDQTFRISENSSVGTYVGQVNAYDADNYTLLRYYITGGNTNNAFTIAENDGTITVLNKNALDYEVTPSFILNVKVKDNKNGVAFANITVNLDKVEIPPTGLILYMPFDGNLEDKSLCSNNGIDHTTSNYVDGIKSQALDFNGVSDYIRLSNTIYSGNGLSFSFWLKSRGAVSTENNGTIICKYSMTYHRRCFALFSFGADDTRSENRLTAVFYPYGDSPNPSDLVRSDLDQSDLTDYPNPSLWTLSNPKSIPLNTWTHCVVNVTPTTIETWIDGELCTSKQREYSIYYDSDYEPVYIGNNLSSGAGSNNHYNGAIDELRIYNRALSNAEITALFQNK